MGTSRGLASPYLLLSLTSLVWSLNWIVGKAVVGTVSPLTLTFARWLVAVLAMLPFAWPQIRAHWPLIRKRWRWIAWVGFWGTGVHNAFAYVGLQYTTATNGLLLNSALPMMIVITGWAIYRDTITVRQALGVAASFGGVMAILTRGDIGALASLTLNRGDVIVVSGMIFWAIYTVLLRTKPAGLPPLAMLACCACVGLVLLAPMAAVEILVWGGGIELTPGAFAAILYVGLFPSFIGYVFWNRAVSEVGANVAGLFVHLMPVFGSLLAWLFLDERLHLFHLGGAVLIVAGIVLTSRGARLP